MHGVIQLYLHHGFTAYRLALPWSPNGQQSAAICLLAKVSSLRELRELAITSFNNRAPKHSHFEILSLPPSELSQSAVEYNILEQVRFWRRNRIAPCRYSSVIANQSDHIRGINLTQSGGAVEQLSSACVSFSVSQR